MPKLSLKSDANQFAFQALPPLQCKGEDLFYLRNGVLNINETILKDREIERCEYRAIAWQSDSFYTYSKTHVREDDPFELKIKHDFFRVECYIAKPVDKKAGRRHENERKLLGVVQNEYVLDQARIRTGMENEQMVGMDHLPEKQAQHGLGEEQIAQQYPLQEQLQEQLQEKPQEQPQEQLQEQPQEQPPNKAVDELEIKDEDYHQDRDYDYRVDDLADYDQFIAQIYPSQEILERLASNKPKKHSLQMNILMFGLDSMSHLSYQRKLPKTYAFLQKTLGAKILNGYNIVGDATTAAMIPLLTGEFTL